MTSNPTEALNNNYNCFNCIAYIFDLDDTLIKFPDNYPELIVCSTLTSFNQYCSVEQANHVWFNPGDTNYIKDNFGIEINDFWNRFNEIDSPILRRNSCTVYDDAKIVIPKLYEENYLLGIVTSSPVDKAKAEIELIGEKYFNSIVCASGIKQDYNIVENLDNYYKSDKIIKTKPDAEGIICCLSHLNIFEHVYKVIYVGDTESDMIAAKKAGIRGIRLDRSKKLPKSENVIHSLDELLEKDF